MNCHHCDASAPQFQCSGCKVAFCGEKCQRENWGEGHDCAIEAYLKEYEEYLIGYGEGGWVKEERDDWKALQKKNRKDRERREKIEDKKKRKREKLKRGGKAELRRLVRKLNMKRRRRRLRQPKEPEKRESLRTV